MFKNCSLNSLSKKLVSLFLIFSLTSCATVFQNENDITVSSTNGPLKVRVTEGDGTDEIFTTPFIFDTTRYRDVVFTVVSDKYESQKFVVERKIRPLAFIFDIIFAPLTFGATLVIDFASGKIYQHETKNLVINNEDLILKKSQALEENKESFIATLKFDLIGLDSDKEQSEVKAHSELKFTRI